MTTPSKLPRTLVVGGGISGLTAAAALARRGFPVEVVEQTPEFSAVGAGITIQANATAILRALEIDLSKDDFVPMGAVEVVDPDGRALTSGNPSAILADPPSMNFHRADLHRGLLDACDGVELTRGVAVSGIQPERKSVVVHFEADGVDGRRSSERFDWVIGADGIHSAVRRSLTGETAADLRYSGQTCWRFALEAPDLVPEISTEHWSPGRRAGVFPLSRGRIYVYLVLSAERGTPGPGTASPEMVRLHFSGIDQLLDAALERLDDEVPISHDDLCDRTRVVFGRGRVTLIGDAAHPMTPNAGQGAGTAIEDAAALALLSHDHAAHPERIPEALSALRGKRVASLQRLSWRIGRVAHWRNPAARFVRDALIRAMPDSTVGMQATRLWKPGIELAAQVRRAMPSSKRSVGSGIGDS